MSSKRAKELKALATALQLVQDDLQQKRFFRKSQYYQETEQYKREKKAKEAAALNLLQDKQITPLISGVLTNAIVNAPPVVFGADEEKEEIIRTPPISGISGDLARATAQLRRSQSEPSKPSSGLLKQIQDVRDLLKPIPDVPKLPPEERRPKSSSESEAEERKSQLIEASKKRRERRTTKTDRQIAEIMGELTAYASGRTRKQFFPVSLVEIMSKNQLANTIKELKNRRSAIVVNVENDKTIMDSYDRKIIQLESRFGIKTGTVGNPSEGGFVVREGGVVSRKRPTPRFSGSDADTSDTSEFEGMGMKSKFLKMYGNGKIKMTKDMKRMLMLMGSIKAGNDNPKLRVEYERLRKKIMKSVHSKMK